MEHLEISYQENISDGNVHNQLRQCTEMQQVKRLCDGDPTEYDGRIKVQVSSWGLRALRKLRRIETNKFN